MIKVFSGKWRGLGGPQETGLGMLIGFEFRKHLAHFKGAMLPVFMAITLHADENGEAYPSYDVLEAETGLGRETIGIALRNLCALKVNGQRVLMRIKVRQAGAKFDNNRYRIFPSAAELAEEQAEQPSAENPTRHEQEPAQKSLDGFSVNGFSVNGSSVNGESALKLNQLEDKPVLSNTLVPQAAPSAPEPEQPNPSRKKGDPIDGMLHFARQAEAQLYNCAHFPADVSATLTRFCELFKIRPPQKGANDYSMWIKAARDLKTACGEFGLAALERAHQDYLSLTDGRRYMVVQPLAFVKACRAAESILRAEQEAKDGAYDPMLDDGSAEYQAALKQWQNAKSLTA